MKKNIKSDNSIKAIFIDVLVIFLCLTIAVGAMFLFFKNLNKTLASSKEEIATISFKKKTVQRKFLGSAIWDRPTQNSPIYDGDLIRTSSLAEATITFKNNNKIILDENTMIQVFADDKNEGTTLNLNSGNISLQTNDTSKMIIKSNQSTVTVQKGSVLRAGKSSSQTMKLIVEEGKASVIKEDNLGSDNKAQSLKLVLTEGEVSEFFDSNVGEGSDEDISKVLKNKKSITMITPGDNLKILNQKLSGEKADINFKWYSSFDQNEKLILETSNSKKFDSILEKFDITGLQELNVKHLKGNLYWRAYSEKKGAKDVSATNGKITVISAHPPKLLFPLKNNKYKFKNNYPTINFIWEGNEAASSYIIEIADNEAIDNPIIKKRSAMTSISFSELTEGEWYWRVTPQYFLGIDFEVEKSQVSNFSIEKVKEIPAPKFISPENFGNLSQGENLNFSWSSVTEATKYKIKISKNKDMSDPVVDSISFNNNFETSEEDMKFLKDSQYYLSVSALDKNNNVLTVTESQKFTVENKKIVFRSVYPPDGYTITDTLCFDTKFTWKSNLETNSIFQISSDKDFSKIYFEKEISTPAISGINLPTGIWYWRVKNNYIDKKVITKTKSIIVTAPLGKPDLINIGKKVIIRENITNTFKWKKIKGADYYQVKIFLPSDDSVVLYENLFITETEIALDLSTIKDGNYIISIQGFSTPTMMSTRRYGLNSDYLTFFKHLKPVKLVYPDDNEQLSGIMCALKNPIFKWSYSEKPKNVRLIIEKYSSKKWQKIQTITNPDINTKVKKLNRGKYRWYLEAITEDDFDISSLNKAIFEVMPIKSLPKPNIIFPEQNHIFGVNFFKKNRTIKFSWTKVKNATNYIFTIYSKGNKKVIQKNVLDNSSKTKTISYELKDLTMLSRGDFFINIKAQRKHKDGTLFQDGIIQQVTFKIDLPKSKKIKTNDTGILYGK